MKTHLTPIIRAIRNTALFVEKFSKGTVAEFYYEANLDLGSARKPFPVRF